MNQTVFHSHLTSYLAGVAIGGAILVSALAGVGQLRLESWTREASLVCLGQASDIEAGRLKAAVLDAQAWRDRLAAGGSLYAAAKLGAIPDPGDAALLRTADDGFAAARARFAAACGLKG